MSSSQFKKQRKWSRVLRRYKHIPSSKPHSSRMILFQIKGTWNHIHIILDTDIILSNNIGMKT